MGKIKIEDLATRMKVDVDIIVKKLQGMGQNVKNGSDLVDENIFRNAKAEATSPHIIRRKVKVVTTDERGNEVERITTNAGGTVQKTSVVHSNKKEETPTYSKEGLGVISSRHSRNTMQNIVVTQNGKKVEAPSVQKEESETSIVEEIENVNVPKENIKPVNVNNNQGQKRYPNARPDQNGYTPRPREQGQMGERRPYQGNRPSVQNDNFVQRGGFQNRDRAPGFNQNRPDRPNGQNGNFVPRGGFQNRDRAPGFNQNRPNGQNGNFVPRSGFQNRDRAPGFNQNRGNNTGYKVNQFIKETQINDTIQKETKNYATTLIDKKKYNTEKTVLETKPQKKNVNEIREQNTRIDFNKLKGMQVSEEGLMDLYDRGESRKYGVRRKKQRPVLGTTKIIPLTEVKLPETMTVKYFAEILKKQASEIIKKLFSLGIMATVNQEIDFDTAFLIAGEFGITAEKEVVVTEEDVLFDDTDDDDENMVVRPPIVTIMGHVDHGKTSLLDKIRSTNVVGGEFGGITQHIGAYKVKINGREITFLDTPGHEAFTEMRARGAQITDIVIIVVASDDSIKPQTIEAIQHAKAANVPIIVAINKIDVQGANIEKVKQDLLDHELVPEEWGGDTICVPVSAKTGEGIENLLEMILLVSDVKELKANPNKQAKGTVIEAKLDKTRGAITTMLVQRGTLNVGDTIVLGDIVGKIRTMINDKGEKVKKAGPSTPVEVLGLGSVPQTGDVFYEVKDEKTAHKLISKRKAKHREDLIKKGGALTLDALYSKIKDGELKNLEIVLRADVQGSAEALKDSLEKLSNEEVRVKVIASNTGAITESDITLASLSNAIVIGFNIKADARMKKMADKANVDLRLYTVIYDAIDDVQKAMNGMLKPIYKEVVSGQAEVRNIFKVSSIGTIAGCYIKSGKVVRNAMIRLIRNGEIITEVKLDSLKREKDDSKEVKEGYECGIRLEKFNDVQEGDILECYELVEEKR